MRAIHNYKYRYSIAYVMIAVLSQEESFRFLCDKASCRQTGRITRSWCLLVFVFYKNVCVSFTLTDRASTIPSNTRGCQSDTWSAGQGKIRGASTKLQREHKKQIKQGKNDKKKGKKNNSTKTSQKR